VVNKLLPISENVEAIAEGNLTIEESVKLSLENIAESNPTYNAIIWQDESFIESQIAELKHKTKDISNEDLLEHFPLLGVPITVKELDSPIIGTENSWGNKVLKSCGWKDSITADTVKLIQNAGAIIVGKTNNPEFGLPIITYSDAHGECLNPLDTLRNAGGSSGGAAACVASGMTRSSLGGDGGGSIRIPSSNCGLWGLKPSRGRISGGPIADQAWSGLASKGPIASSLDDLVRTFNVLAQPIESSESLSQNYIQDAYKDVSKLKIGVRSLGLADLYPIHPAIGNAVNKLVKFLESLGHSVDNVYPDIFDDSSIIKHQSHIIAHHIGEDLYEAIRRSNNTLTFEDCELTTQYFLDLNSEMQPSDFDIAHSQIEKIAKQFDTYFDEYDVLITPTCGDFAPTLDFSESDNDGLAAYIYAGLTFIANMAGAPALSVPVKTAHESGLPAGIQIIAKRGRDDLVLQLGALLEKDYSDIFITNIETITN